MTVIEARGRENTKPVTGGAMAKKRKSNYKIPHKTCWHLYSLQNLNSEKFVKVVNKILRHEWQVIK